MPSDLALRGDVLKEARRRSGKHPWRLIMVFMILAGGLFVTEGARADDKEPAVTIVVSEPIRPYLEAVDGFRETLKANYRVVYLKDGKLSPDLLQSLWVAVGPQAMKEVWQQTGISRKIYMMVLHPDQVVNSKIAPCGVPLDLSFSFQIQVLIQTFPKIRNVGVLFDPRYNRNFMDQAHQVAESLGITLIELGVGSQKEIPGVLRPVWSKLDILWLIPDRTIISEAIIRYLSKESLLHNVALMGYNRFFLESGAAMAFVIDYEELGKRAAQLAESFLREGFCWSMLPPAHLHLKERVLEHLGWEIPDPLPSLVEVE